MQSIYTTLNSYLIAFVLYCHQPSHLPQEPLLLMRNCTYSVIHLKCWTKDPDVAVRLFANTCRQCKNIIARTRLKFLAYFEHVETPHSFADGSKVKAWVYTASCFDEGGDYVSVICVYKAFPTQHDRRKQ